MTDLSHQIRHPILIHVLHAGVTIPDDVRARPGAGGPGCASA